MKAMIVIAGAGPAGSVAAHRLARAGASVVMIAPVPVRTGRLELASPRTCRTFAAAGLARLFERPDLARPCHGIEHVDRTGEAGWQPFDSGAGEFGYVLDRDALDEAMLAHAVSAGVTLLRDRVLRVTRCGGSFDLVLSGSGKRHSLTADMIVDATGRRAGVACRLGARSAFGERRIALRVPAAPRAREIRGMRVAWEGGGWTTTMIGPADRFEQWRVGAPETCGPRRGVLALDASPRLSLPSAGQGWIAIGDAAAAFDPVNSQGLEHAINSARVAAGAILSEGGITDEVCRHYDLANRLTAASADLGRMATYAEGPADHGRRVPAAAIA